MALEGLGDVQTLGVLIRKPLSVLGTRPKWSLLSLSTALLLHPHRQSHFLDLPCQVCASLFSPSLTHAYAHSHSGTLTFGHTLPLCQSHSGEATQSELAALWCVVAEVFLHGGTTLFSVSFAPGAPGMVELRQPAMMILQ